jgi:ABC-type cobalamin/Fe3+-siderophores transport system ATPase subunit
MYRLENVSLSYGTSMVLTEVTWSCPLHGIVSMIGPNGAGKSSLLRILAGLQNPIAGNIYISEKKLSSFSRLQISRLVAYVPQDFTPGFSISVIELLKMGRYPYSNYLDRLDSDGKEIIDTIIEKFNLATFCSRLFHTLSAGERQKVLIAAALVQQPQCLLLDEPTSALDPGQGEELFFLLKTIAEKDNIVVLVVTHDTNSALVYSDALVALKKGKVIFCGTPEKFSDECFYQQLYNVPAQTTDHPHRAVKLFIPGLKP